MEKFKWLKHGLVFNPREVATPQWMEEFAQAPSVLIFEKFVRVYFSCRPKADANGQYVSYSAFVDLDKENLFKIINISPQPIIELGKLGSFDEFGIYPVSVIKREKEYIAYYAGWTRCESVPFNVAIGIAISKNNGVSFNKIGDGPVISYSPFEPFVISGPKIRKFNDKYYLFYIAGSKWVLDNGKPEPVYKIRMAESNDGISWHKLNMNLIENRIEEDEAQASPDVFFMNDMYHMFFCFRRSINYRNKENGYRIGYAYSYDLIHWNRNDDYAGIDVSDVGWDSQMISYPHIFELNNKIYMFYLGNDVGKNGFGLAELIT